MVPGDPAVRNAWGTLLDSTIPLIEQLAAGVVSIDLTGVASHTLSTANNAPDEARMAFLLFTGASSGTATITVPGIARIGYVANQSANPIVLTTGGGTTLTVPTATSFLYRCDAANITAVTIGSTGAQSFPGGITGPLAISGTTTFDAIAVTGAATVGTTLAVTGAASAAKFSGFGTIPIAGGMDFFGPAAPAGWLFAAGQAVSRTTYAALFAILGTTFGAGDGSTTFNLPDKRGRLSLPMDNLGGSAANRVTVFAATALGGAGGDQNLQSHTHTVTDPTHNHTITQIPHGHSLVDPGHTHGITDPGHAHTTGLGAASVQGGVNVITTASGGSTSTGTATTGISVNAALTGMSIVPGSANVTNVAASTGITNQTTGTGTAQNMPPVLVCTYIIYAGA